MNEWFRRSIDRLNDPPPALRSQQQRFANPHSRRHTLVVSFPSKHTNAVDILFSPIPTTQAFPESSVVFVRLTRKDREHTAVQPTSRHTDTDTNITMKSPPSLPLLPPPPHARRRFRGRNREKACRWQTLHLFVSFASLVRRRNKTNEKTQLKAVRVCVCVCVCVCMCRHDRHTSIDRSISLLQFSSEQLFLPKLTV